MVRSALLLSICLLLDACAELAVGTAPRKTASVQPTPKADHAVATAWDDFIEGRYDRIDPDLELLSGAYLDDPLDPRVAAFLGYMNLWRAAEFKRVTPTPSIINNMAAARHYLAEARLMSDEPFLSALAPSSSILVAHLDKNVKEERRAFFELKALKASDPGLAAFVFGNDLSQVAKEDPVFAEALDSVWSVFDVCIDGRFDRQNPDYRPYVSLPRVTTGPRRYCWNTPKAPHLLEGAFMVLGDMLVKNGDVATARIAYESAKSSPGYASWPFKDILQARVDTIDERARLFAAIEDPREEPELVVNSGKYSCVVCHQSQK